MTVKRKHRRPGRPRDAAKLEAILDAANALFLERGIAATTMDAVAERASVSKMTVYANFRDKPAVLAAVLDHRIKSLYVFDEFSVGPDLNSSVERLVKLGQAAVSVITQPQVIRMTRLMGESATQHPQLAGDVLCCGPWRIVEADRGVLESSNQARICLD